MAKSSTSTARTEAQPDVDTIVDQIRRALAVAAANGATKDVPPSETSPVERSTIGMRNALFDELDAIRAGNGDRRRAFAVAALCGRILDTVRLEIEYAKQTSLAGTGGDSVKTIESLRLDDD